MTLFERATNPKQYDEKDVIWENEVSLDSPTRKFFWDYLCKYDWKGKSVLDIGCGSGWLMSLIKEAGAIHVEGIEPSDKNIHLANKYYPQLEIHHCSIEEYNTQKKYDIIISVMALNHIADPTRVFRKIEKMLNGDLIIVVPDYDYHIMPRNNYKMKIERINQSETVVEVVRPQGTIADVVRKIEIYQSALKGSKLKIIRQRPMYPTEALMQSIPVFRNHKDRPITVLIHAKCDQ